MTDENTIQYTHSPSKRSDSRHTWALTEYQLREALTEYLRARGMEVPEGRVWVWGLEHDNRPSDPYDYDYDGSGKRRKRKEPTVITLCVDVPIEEESE